MKPRAIHFLAEALARPRGPRRQPGSKCRGRVYGAEKEGAAAFPPVDGHFAQECADLAEVGRLWVPKIPPDL